MTDLDRFAIFELPPNVTGHTALFLREAAFIGSRNSVLERIHGSRARNDSLRLINDAEHARGTLQSIRQREQDVAKRERAVQSREDAVAERELADAIRKMDATAARFDAYDHEQQANSEENQLTLPPGQEDDGELQTPYEEVDDEAESIGDLPPALTKEVPPETGTDPETPGAREPSYRSPVSMED